MNLHETDNQLTQALQALQARVDALDNGGGAGGAAGGGGSGKEDASTRITRERQERVAQQELKNFARKQEKPERSPHYANPKRQEEAVKRHNTRLDAPVAKAVEQKVEKGGVGDGIEFYCYQNGEVGKMVILTESGFTSLPL